AGEYADNAGGSGSADTGSNAIAVTIAEPGSKPGTKSEPDAESDSGRKSDAESDSGRKSEPDAEPDRIAKPESDAEPCSGSGSWLSLY
ncbi:MAG TPA: hypothetical protein VFB65_16785, partial [Pyrinomonadaceae bacterium]|nr:hypothetical protein [Pyrinomonadaceae bacterium]